MSGPYTYDMVPCDGSRAWRVADAKDNRVATCYLREHARAVTEALNMARARGRWVACADAMPPTGTRVLATLRTGEMTTLAWWEDSKLWAPGVIGPGPIYRSHKVTHWMPLPPGPVQDQPTHGKARPRRAAGKERA